MDARLIVPTPRAPSPSARYTPPRAPLAMPRQPLHDAQARRLDARGGRWRFGLVFAAASALTVLAGVMAFDLFSSDGFGWLDALSLIFVSLNVFWIASAAVTVGAGAVLLAVRPAADAEAAVPKRLITMSRTALIYPVYNEDFARVLAQAQSSYEALGADVHVFDVFFLSDSNTEEAIEAEEAAMAAFRAGHPDLPFYYRRRRFNLERKAGNIADFVRNWGGRYDYMVVYDADSVMTPEALRILVKRMDASPNTAIIQTVPRIIRAQSLYARMQRFALSAYGPLFGYGLAWWSGGSGNYWGHNAIVRVKAFAAHAGLPVLDGAPPFGGHILSHDFVEAAFLRRAGWRVEIAPEIGGSYEQAPPTLIDAAMRDRRWAQGNLQHVAILGARGLDWLSRMHIAAGIMGYMSSLLWTTLFVLGLATSWSGSGGGGANMADEALRLGLFTAAIVLAPKWLALGLWLIGKLPHWRGNPYFPLALLLETIASAVIAPISMAKQSVAIAATLMGRDAGWRAQVRERSHLELGFLVRLFAPYKALAGLVAVGSFAASPAMAMCIAPATFSLLSAALISHLMAKSVPQHTWLWRVTEHARPAQAERL
jgi:membrane glycosyltransferase